MGKSIEQIESKCRCSMSISILGDGCRYCQPQEYIDRLIEQIDDDKLEVISLIEKRIMSYEIDEHTPFAVKNEINHKHEIRALKSILKQIKEL